MINLLSPTDRSQLLAARSNTLILRYILLLSVVIVIMALEMLSVYLLLNNDMRNSQALIDDNNSKAQKYDSIAKQASAFQTNLAISKYVLNKQIPYTSLIFAIAGALPNKSDSYATLAGINITPVTFGTPITMIIQTSNPDTAIQVKTNLQQVKYNNKNIFSAVSFDSIANPDPSAQRYTYEATYKVTFATDITAQ